MVTKEQIYKYLDTQNHEQYYDRQMGYYSIGMMAEDVMSALGSEYEEQEESDFIFESVVDYSMERELNLDIN